MSLLHLRRAAPYEGDSDVFQCPNCGKPCAPDEWTTEYGDPIAGEHWVVCPHCLRDFTILVEVNLVYRPLK